MLSSDERRSKLENLLGRVHQNRNRPRVRMVQKVESEIASEPEADAMVVPEAELKPEKAKPAEVAVDEAPALTPEQEFFGEESGAVMASMEPEPASEASKLEDVVLGASASDPPADGSMPIELSKLPKEDELEEIEELEEIDDTFDDDELAEVEAIEDDSDLKSAEDVPEILGSEAISAPLTDSGPQEPMASKTPAAFQEPVAAMTEETRTFQEAVAASSDVAVIKGELKPREWTLAAVLERAFKLGESK